MFVFTFLVAVMEGLGDYAVSGEQLSFTFLDDFDGGGDDIPLQRAYAFMERKLLSSVKTMTDDRYVKGNNYYFLCSISYVALFVPA